MCYLVAIYLINVVHILHVLQGPTCPMRDTLWDVVGHRGTHVTCPMVSFRQDCGIT